MFIATVRLPPEKLFIPEIGIIATAVFPFRKPGARGLQDDSSFSFQTLPALGFVFPRCSSAVHHLFSSGNRLLVSPLWLIPCRNGPCLCSWAYIKKKKSHLARKRVISLALSLTCTRLLALSSTVRRAFLRIQRLGSTVKWVCHQKATSLTPCPRLLTFPAGILPSDPRIINPDAARWQ